MREQAIVPISTRLEPPRRPLKKADRFRIVHYFFGSTTNF
jgi:transposase